MKNITEEQKRDRYNALPQSLRDALSTEVDSIWEIGEENHLSEDKIQAMALVIGGVILGFVHPDNINKEIKEETGIDHRIAEAVGGEILKRILVPILPDIQRLYRITTKQFPIIPTLITESTQATPVKERATGTQDPSAGLLTPAFKEQTVPAAESAPAPRKEPAETPVPQAPPTPSTPESLPPSTTSVPAFEKPSAPQENLPTTEPSSEPLLHPQMPTNEPTPFIIHEEETIEPLASGKEIPLSRPHFFKSTAGESTGQKAVSARLEIGEEPQAQEAPQVGRTEKEDVRVVNYTGPELKVDPFKRPTGQMPSAPAQEESTGAIPKARQPVERAATSSARQTSSGETPDIQEKAPELATKEPKEISPDNIVNLKDIPR